MARQRYEYRSKTKRERIETVINRYGATDERRRTQVKCCRCWLTCDGFTNTCPTCGADYNWNGSRLAPREYWGEETGEHPDEIANIR